MVGWAPDNIAATLRLSYRVENGLTDGTSTSTGRIVKTSSRRPVACKVSSAWGGGNGCFSTSRLNQRSYRLSVRWKVSSVLLSSFPLQILAPEVLEYCRVFNLHFSSVSTRLAAKHSVTQNSLKKWNVLKEHRLNYILMPSKSSPVLFLEGDEPQNLHVKMVKITWTCP